MMRKITRIGLGTAALGSLVVGVNVTPAAAVGCYGYSCNGKGPSAMGCDADAFTAVNKQVKTVYIELRHSWNCGASWVRITGGSNDYAWVKNSDGAQYRKDLGSGGGSDWSAMVANIGASMWAQACGHDRLNNTGDQEGCTSQW